MQVSRWIDHFKKYLTWIILAVSVGVLVFIIRSDDELQEAFSRGTLHPGWMVAACAIFLLSVAMEGILLKVILSCYREKYSLWRSLRIALVTRYYSAITPTNLGGQPAALLRLMGDGISPAAAGMCVGMHVVFFQFAQFFLQLMMLFFLPRLVLNLNPVVWFAMGFGIFSSSSISVLGKPPAKMITFILFPLFHDLLRFQSPYLHIFF